VKKTISEFRKALYQNFIKRADTLFNLVDALTVAGHVSSPVALSEETPFARKFSSVYDGLENGEMNMDDLLSMLPGNVDDRKPVPTLCKRLFGKLIADRGYISQALFEQLLETFNVQLITRIKKNMKNRLMPMIDKLLLRKRAVIESVMDQLKNISQIEHTRHRSPINAFINIIAGLVVYCHQPQKTSLAIIPNGLPLLAA